MSAWPPAINPKEPAWRLPAWRASFIYDIRQDVGETTNIADAHPDVVKSLTAKMDARVESLGAALSHLPQKLDGQPWPEGDVLEVSVTVTVQAKPKDRLAVPFAGLDGDVSAGDHIEYDIAVATDSLRQGFYYTPFKGQEQDSMTLDHRRLGTFHQHRRAHRAGKPSQDRHRHRKLITKETTRP